MLKSDHDAIAPHGGVLVNRTVSGNDATAIVSRAGGLATLMLNPREEADLGLIAIGALSPLQGFMGRADYERVVAEMRLADGTLWSLPITLSASSEETRGVSTGTELALLGVDGAVRGIVKVSEIFPYDKQREAQEVYGTTDEAHPGVSAMYRQKELLVAGTVTVLARDTSDPMAEYALDPSETRESFRQRGWRTVVGFQTRNPVHRAHEYIQKAAMEIVDGLLLHPLVGETKSDDIPADVRMQCYKALLDNYYPTDRVLLSTLPAAMRYAGPREAVFHALVRKNYGCTHFIVGRDHAGVGGYYGTFAAQDLLRSLPADYLGITPLYFDNSFFCNRCSGMASAKTCPHGAADRVSLSGTQVRAMLVNGEMPPVEFTRPEVAQILIEAARTEGVGATR